MKALIIEDEVMAAESLRKLILEAEPDTEIVNVIQTVEESIEWLGSNPSPDIIFADIHLADGSSFSVFERVKVSCPIVFTTAYDEYALRAFEVNSIDYLLKPIGEKEVRRALDKYKKLNFSNSTQDAMLESFLREYASRTKNYKSHFLVAQRDKLIPVSSDNIAYVYIDQKSTKLVTMNGISYSLSKNLDEMMQQLDKNAFFRANRQFIVAHKAIKDISFWFGNKLLVNLSVSCDEDIVISKMRVPEFKEWYSK